MLQVVWKKSTQLNCGYATFTKGNYNSYYVVCQYYPAGNYAGQYAANVAPLSDENGNDGNGNGNSAATVYCSIVVVVTTLILLFL